mmetsp:Transcript_35204/g.88939  ORF Transcript_35204/g.88939 Transcript_35204/m.88939 type:complete len:231 (-) Transcript_35204:355-1047(-)|eukprot:CAMPEP_0173462584 /NCGR_PEP_ID=MMETSP1357-20121228/66868_1 /TAXON_ID=77926 /ORGANISM="Hemiselmis rufescens, Strain PCC563" /LENGTH=230 /DNA_ID=CAMNT_0014430321 /DNA_START=152 /DNA_END=844 /DNA_ORIENTATION=+
MAAAAFWPEQIRDLDRNLHGDIVVFAVQNVACAITIVTVVSPFPVVRKVTKRRSSGDYSFLPYLLNFFSSLLALGYGIFVHNRFLIMINTFCLMLTTTFLFLFMRVCPLRKMIRTLIIVGILMLCFTYHYVTILPGRQGHLLLGTIQNFVTICCYASPLATVKMVFKTRSADSLPFLLVFMSCINGMCWLLYGLLIQDTFVQFPSLVGTSLSFFQLSLFAMFPSSKIMIM